VDDVLKPGGDALSKMKRGIAAGLFALLAATWDWLILVPASDSGEGPAPPLVLLPGGTGSLDADVLLHATTAAMVVMGLVAAAVVATGRWRTRRSVFLGLALYGLCLTSTVLLLLRTGKQ
jgi:hypothetical protein